MHLIDKLYPQLLEVDDTSRMCVPFVRSTPDKSDVEINLFVRLLLVLLIAFIGCECNRVVYYSSAGVSTAVPSSFNVLPSCSVIGSPGITSAIVIAYVMMIGVLP